MPLPVVLFWVEILRGSGVCVLLGLCARVGLSTTLGASGRGGLKLRDQINPKIGVINPILL